MSASPCHDDPELAAALYALGCLSAGEAGAFEEHLRECATCRAEVGRVQGPAAALAFLAPEVEPPAELRGRLLERVAALRAAPPADAASASAPPAQSWREWEATPTGNGPVFVPAASSGWEPTGVAGVTAKRLFVDPEHDRVTLLVRMTPGTSYPPHRHGGPEECFLLEGDLSDGEVTMHAGDYLRREGGSLHGRHSTEQGCLMLIVSSLHDELLPANPA